MSMLKIMSEEEISHTPGGYLESLTEVISEIWSQNKMGFFSYFENTYDDTYYRSDYYHDYDHPHCHHDRVWSG